MTVGSDSFKHAIETNVNKAETLKPKVIDQKLRIHELTYQLYISERLKAGATEKQI